MVTAGRENEEFEGLTLKKGRTNLATKVNASSKLIKIEETGASLPGRAEDPGDRHLHAVGAGPGAVATSSPRHFEGDEAKRKGMGGLGAIDEVTMVLMPDLWAVGQRRRRCATSRAR